MKRIVYIDTLRCVAMLLVILLHCLNPVITQPDYYQTLNWNIGIVLNAFCRCGVPLFFMMSGCLLMADEKTGHLSSFYRERMARLLIPLLCWNMIFFLFSGFFDNTGFSPKVFIENFVNNGSYYHIWYVYSLLGIYLMAPFLKRLVDSSSTRETFVLWLIILFPGTIRPFLNHILPVYIYLFDPLIQGYCGYFIMGYLLGNFSLKRKWRVLIYLGGAIGVLISVIGNAAASSEENINLVFNQGYAITHYLISAAIFTAAKYGTVFSKTVIRRISYRLSVVSFGVYWIHPIFLRLVQQYLSLTLQPIEIVTVYFLIISAASITASILIYKSQLLKKLLL